MSSTLLDAYAAALRSRASTAPCDAEVRRAAILLEDFQRCRDSAIVLETVPAWARSAVERAADAALRARRADRDDVHWASLTHPGSIIWPVVTEIGRVTSAPGSLRLAAALVGYSALTGLAAALGTAHATVFHVTATAGVVAAAATSAVLLRLDDDRWPHALGHALSVTGGSRGAMVEYSGTRCFHSAHAVRTGIAAALCAQRGIDATSRDLERRQGALATLDPERLLADDDHALAASSLRIFPTSGWNQAAYEAAFDAASQARGRIRGVLVGTPAAAPPGVAVAASEAVAAARGHSPTDLADLIHLSPDTGTTSVRIEADERAAEVVVDAPLDHPSRPAELDRIATLKWHCAPSQAADRVTQIIAELSGREDT